MSEISTEYKPVNFIRGILHPLGAKISVDTTYTIPLASVEQTAFVIIPKEYLISSNASTQSLIITTGVASSETVIVPISPSGDTITSPSLMFNLYIDTAGNVYSDNFIVSGSNSNGSYIKFADGTMNVTGSISPTQTTSSGGPWSSSPFYNVAYSFTYPSAFLANSAVFPIVNVYAGTGTPWVGYILNSTITGFSVYLYGHTNTDSGNLYYIAIGRWK
jgi:hypothetical protein